MELVWVTDAEVCNGYKLLVTLTMDAGKFSTAEYCWKGVMHCMNHCKM